MERFTRNKKYKGEITDDEGKKWLKFGPHALDFDTAPHAQTPAEQKKSFDLIYKEIDRFAGKGAHSKFVRLHYYSESFELSEFFRKKRVKALFSTDREVGTYRMGEKIGLRLKDVGVAGCNGMNFIRTHYRVEFFKDDGFGKREIKKAFKISLDKYGYVIFYTHEYELVKPEIKRLLNISMDSLEELGIPAMKSI